jgi:hypothetical protein
VANENRPLERDRYRREGDHVIVDVAVKNSRQLFNERDPAPFRDRDLDENFANYVLSSVKEFPLKTKMKLRVVIRDETDQMVEQAILHEAIHSFFTYEAQVSQARLRQRLRVGRWFFFVGLFTLFVCISISRFLIQFETTSGFSSIAREGFVIIGWVAMWRPVEVFLYDWWPLREERLYLEKIAGMAVKVECGGLDSYQSSTKRLEK